MPEIDDGKYLALIFMRCRGTEIKIKPTSRTFAETSHSIYTCTSVPGQVYCKSGFSYLFWLTRISAKKIWCCAQFRSSARYVEDGKNVV